MTNFARAVAKKEIEKLCGSNKKYGSFLIFLEYFFGLQVAKNKEKKEEAAKLRT